MSSTGILFPGEPFILLKGGNQSRGSLSSEESETALILRLPLLFLRFDQSAARKMPLHPCAPQLPLSNQELKLCPDPNSSCARVEERLLVLQRLLLISQIVRDRADFVQGRGLARPVAQ